MILLQLGMYFWISHDIATCNAVFQWITSIGIPVIICVPRNKYESIGIGSCKELHTAQTWKMTNFCPVQNFAY